MRIPELIEKAQKQAIQDVLIEVLAEVQTCGTVREARHVIKSKILKLK